MRTFLFIGLVFLVSCNEKIKDYPLSRFSKDSKVKIFSVEEFKQKFSCTPSLISLWVQEKSEFQETFVKYGKLEIMRSDNGDSDGFLEVKYDEKCKIELSLMPEIYFSHKDKLLVISGYSGSSSSVEIFDLNQKCEYLGIVDTTGINQLFEDWKKSQGSGCKN